MNRFLRLHVKIVVWTGILSFFLNHGTQAASYDDRSVVYIECLSSEGKESKGTGVIVSREGLVLTAFHVAPRGSSCNASIGQAKAPKQGMFPSALQAIMPIGLEANQWDITAWKLAAPAGTQFQFLKMCPLKNLDGPETLKQKRAIARGFPVRTTTGEISGRSGVISTVEPDVQGLVGTDILTARGMSGGPVILENTNVLVGIISGAKFDRATGQPIEYNIFDISLLPDKLGLVSREDCYDGKPLTSEPVVDPNVTADRSGEPQFEINSLIQNSRPVWKIPVTSVDIREDAPTKVGSILRAVDGSTIVTLSSDIDGNETQYIFISAYDQAGNPISDWGTQGLIRADYVDRKDGNLIAPIVTTSGRIIYVQTGLTDAWLTEYNKSKNKTELGFEVPFSQYADFPVRIFETKANRFSMLGMIYDSSLEISIPSVMNIRISNDTQNLETDYSSVSKLKSTSNFASKIFDMFIDSKSNVIIFSKSDSGKIVIHQYTSEDEFLGRIETTFSHEKYIVSSNSERGIYLVERNNSKIGPIHKININSSGGISAKFSFEEISEFQIPKKYGWIHAITINDEENWSAIVGKSSKHPEALLISNDGVLLNPSELDNPDAKMSLVEIERMSDGGIVAAISMAIGGTRSAKLAKINDIGQVDQEFGTNGVSSIVSDVPLNFSDLHVSSRGEVIVLFSQNDNSRLFVFTRLGKTVGAFGNNGAINLAGFSAVQIVSAVDGSVFLVGSVKHSSFLSSKVTGKVVKLMRNGKLDTSFGFNGVQIVKFDHASLQGHQYVFSAGIGKENSLLIGLKVTDKSGFLDGLGNVKSVNFVIKLGPSGNIDPNFADAGFLVVPEEFTHLFVDAQTGKFATAKKNGENYNLNFFSEIGVQQPRRLTVGHPARKLSEGRFYGTKFEQARLDTVVFEVSNEKLVNGKLQLKSSLTFEGDVKPKFIMDSLTTGVVAQIHSSSIRFVDVGLKAP